MILDRNFREFIGLLDARGVEYIIVGGHAVAFHGFPRYTGDLDIFVARSAPNARALLHVFRAFGFGDLALQENDFLTEDLVIEIGREPLKIQVLTGIDGVTFEECFAERIVLETDGLRLVFPSLRHLLANKVASGRPKDQIDVVHLRRLAGLDPA